MLACLLQNQVEYIGVIDVIFNNCNRAKLSQLSPSLSSGKKEECKDGEDHTSLYDEVENHDPVEMSR